MDVRRTEELVADTTIAARHGLVAELVSCRKLFAAAVFILASGGVSAIAASDESLVPFKDPKTKLVGFLDLDKLGSLPRIGASYLMARPFSEGRSAVKVVAGWGFIDGDGEVLIGTTYENVASFSNGLAAVAVRDKAGGGTRWGFVDRTGGVKIPPTFDEVWSFSEGFALVRTGTQFHFVDKSGKSAFEYRFLSAKPFRGGVAAVQTDDKSWCFLSSAGALIGKGAAFGGAGNFSDGSAAVQQGGRWGYISKDGKMTISPQFLKAGEFGSGLAPVEVSGDGKSAWKFINSTGAVAFEASFARAGSFSGGKAAVRRGRAWEYIDTTGKTTVDGAFMWAGEFSSSGRAIVLDHFGRTSVIDDSGRIVTTAALQVMADEQATLFDLTLETTGPGAEAFVVPAWIHDHNEDIRNHVDAVIAPYRVSDGPTNVVPKVVDSKYVVYFHQAATSTWSPALPVDVRVGGTNRASWSFMQ